MTAQVAPKPVAKADEKKTTKPVAAVPAGKEDEEGDDEEEGSGRPRSHYFIAKVVKKFESKREATKFLSEHKLKEGEAILKGRTAEYRPVEAYELD